MPNYYRFLFGPKYAKTSPVGGGRYAVGIHYTHLCSMQPGDQLLLYCAGGYPGYSKMVWGSGKVTQVTPPPSGGGRWLVCYTPKKFPKPVSRATMLAVAAPADQTTLSNNNRQWIVAVSKQTFDELRQVGGDP